MPKNTALPKEVEEVIKHELETILGLGIAVGAQQDHQNVSKRLDKAQKVITDLLTQAHQDTEPWTGTIAEGWMPTELNFRSEAEARQWLTTKYEEIKQSPDRYKENFGWKNKQKTYFTAKMCSETNNENGHEFDEVDVSYEISPMKFVEQLAPSEQLSEEHD